MSGLPVRIEPEAQDDYQAAVIWYESQIPGLSNDFEAEIERTFQKIILNPKLYRVAYKRHNLRRVFVSRFPFKVYYVVTSQEILIKAFCTAGRMIGYSNSAAEILNGPGCANVPCKP